MPEGGDTIPTEALEDVAYLSRSTNRIRILDALTEKPSSRRNLVEVTETSRTTLDRIVNELEQRGWAERTNDGNYVGTPAGTHLMEEVRPFVDSVEAIRRLDETVAWLPADELTIGLHHFSDAEVLRPENDDPSETVDHLFDLFREIAEFRVLAHLVSPTSLTRVMRERIAAGELTADCVLTDEHVEYLLERPDRRARWRDMIERGADVFRVQGPIPCNMLIFDDTLFIKKSGPGPIEDTYGVPIRSENPAVRSWAHDLIDRWRDDATRLDAETFAEEPAASRTDVDRG